MTYMDAVGELLLGQRMRRKGWEQPKAYLQITDGKMYKHTGYGHYTEWAKPLSDIRATDWTFYEP